MPDQRPLSEWVLRRDVLVILLAMGTLSFPALSETPIKVARVGYLTLAGRTGVIAENILPGFREGLQEKGYTEGRTLVLEQRYAEGDEERLPVFVSEFLGLRLDVLFTVGTQVARAVQHATSTLPVVAITGEPVGAGLVRSLTRPGGNITGVALQNPEYSVKWLELLKEAVPNLQRVAVLWNPNNPTVALEIEAMRKAAPVLGLELSIFSGERSKLEASLGAIAIAAVDGLVITDDASFDSIGPRLALLAIESHLPNICGLGEPFVQQGGLMSYSANWFEAGRRAAYQVARILNGAHPADLPIDQTTEFAIAINLKTAKQLGLTIPGPLLARADRVIE